MVFNTLVGVRPGLSACKIGFISLIGSIGLNIRARRRVHGPRRKETATMPAHDGEGLAVACFQHNYGAAHNSWVSEYSPSLKLRRDKQFMAETYKLKYKGQFVD